MINSCKWAVYFLSGRTSHRDRIHFNGARKDNGQTIELIKELWKCENHNRNWRAIFGDCCRFSVVWTHCVNYINKMLHKMFSSSHRSFHFGVSGPAVDAICCWFYDLWICVHPLHRRRRWMFIKICCVWRVFFSYLMYDILHHIQRTIPIHYLFHVGRRVYQTVSSLTKWVEFGNCCIKPNWFCAFLDLLFFFVCVLFRFVCFSAWETNVRCALCSSWPMRMKFANQLILHWRSNEQFKFNIQYIVYVLLCV